MATILSQRSSNFITFNAIAINYSTLTGSTITNASTLTTSSIINTNLTSKFVTVSTLTINSTIVSLGQSTNQTYTTLAQGAVSTTTYWINTISTLVSTKTVPISANAQYQLALTQVSTTTSVQYTSTLGTNWSTLSGVSGLPTATQTNYTAGAISGTGKYIALAAYAGYPYVSNNYGASFTNVNPNVPYIYLPFEIAPTTGSSSLGSNPATLTVYGAPGVVSGIVGSNALNLTSNSQFVRCAWSTPSTFSFSFWFNTQTSGVQQNIIFTNLGSAGIFISAANLIFVYANGTYIPYNGYPVSMNTWYNVTAVFQASGPGILYMNNVLVGNGTCPASLGTSTGFFTIGNLDATNGAQPFIGYVDDFKLYNSAITFSPMVPMNYNNITMSSTGQYMLISTVQSGLYMSSNYGVTWVQVPSTLLLSGWQNSAISSSGQYMIANNNTTTVVSPQLTGLTFVSTSALPIYFSWVQNGITWTSFCSSNNDSSSFQSWAAFNNIGAGTSPVPYSFASNSNYSNGVYNNTYSIRITGTTTSPSPYTGEWIQIQSSVPVVMYSYNFACGGTTNIPKTYYIVGSNVASTYSAYTTAAYTYFRLIANTLHTSGANLEFEEWYVQFTSGNTQITSGITSSYSPLKTGLTGDTTTSTAVTTTWSQSGITWSSLASSVASGAFQPWRAFQGTLSGSWAGSNFSYNESTGAYAQGTRAETPIIGVGTIQGEWIQIQSSVPLIMYNYGVTSASSLYNVPKIYYIVGSTDNTNWYPIQYVSMGATNPFTTTSALSSTYFYINNTLTQNFTGQITVRASTLSYPTSTNAYTYFRMIVTNIYFPATYGNAELGLWPITFTTTNNTGTQLYTSNYGATWTAANTIPTNALAISGSGQYAIAVNSNPIYLPRMSSYYIISNYLAGFNTGTYINTAINYSSTAGTLAYYSLNDIAGNTSLLESINAYNATLSGTVTLGTTGKAGTCAYFNGGYLSLSSSLYSTWNNLTSGSIACWIYPTAQASLNGSILFAKQHNSVNSYSVLGIGGYGIIVPQTAGKVYFQLSNQFSSASCSSNTILALNTWYHIAVTFTSSAIQFYINGVLDNTFSAAWNLPDNTATSSMTVGAYYSGSTAAYQFYGNIDEFSLWNVTLSAASITALYSLGPIGSVISAACSNTGQYMVLATNNTSGNNVYYSSDYGTTFTGITIGSTVLTSCAISYDGAYITVANATSVYTLNNNYSGYSVAIGSQAGVSNQMKNAIAIGQQAGIYNQEQSSIAIGAYAGLIQVANSIILNASGQGLNSYYSGFYVSPISTYTMSPSASLSLLAYGTDNQITQTTGAITLLSSGYVGIGTTNPTSALQVIGNIAGTTKTFDIPHPLSAGKRLVHSAIEGPRCDLIYRGTIALNNGSATVNIDAQCTYDPTCAMDQGTFVALCANPQCLLQNMTGFDAVNASIQEGILIITCQNLASTDMIHWTIIAERKDSFIKQWDRTNANGYLITQYST